MSLDPRPSDAELLRMRDARLRRFETGVRDARTVTVARNVTGPRAPTVIGDPAIAVRNGDVLSLVLRFPPRTKKGHTTLGIRQSQGYRRFKAQVVDHLASFREQLSLPLPDGPYNCCALFYVDNDAADTVGLIQGLADALQDAGVITNDRQLRTWNGTDQSIDKTRPRVELTISPI